MSTVCSYCSNEVSIREVDAYGCHCYPADTSLFVAPYTNRHNDDIDREMGERDVWEERMKRALPEERKKLLQHCPLCSGYWPCRCQGGAK